ncbi:MAG: hypothetical protein WKI04_11250 [Ferruginibacter sp.]
MPFRRGVRVGEVALARFAVVSPNLNQRITLATTGYGKDTTVAEFKIERINLFPPREAG